MRRGCGRVTHSEIWDVDAQSRETSQSTVESTKPRPRERTTTQLCLLGEKTATRGHFDHRPNKQRYPRGRNYN
jgi:hypothetical protein